MARWLLKSEPDVFSYDDLVRVGREGWDGIRSYQARNFLRDMRRGEQADLLPLEREATWGRRHARSSRRPSPTRRSSIRPATTTTPRANPPTPLGWVTVAPVRGTAFVSLDELRTLPELARCRLLAKGNRLSVVPLSDAEFDAIVAFARRRRTSPAKSK